MSKLTESIQSADWKAEKHVPVIECAAAVKAGEGFDVRITVGREIAHPNTVEHHIRWIDLYFQADGAKFPYQVGHFEFSAHGESAEGPNQGPVHALSQVTATVKVTKPGVLTALALCNIHGLWQSEKPVGISG
ncbi:MAG: class II SORL domain-containing protein [bacterium]|nr:class II SORL domain-containing protein [bacterium]